ncbi:hypothetical protein [Leptothrix discophora]|uniref:Uncharacterized protein n=1 Tax=Leptothrix discophora TaxID=89 RepID=A0ABT9G9B4_LEPDI|nr:hypothetical protein [Leptothrix discophora]MDP4302957.1 hypothetical protein [Leptothrix discophora]
MDRDYFVEESLRRMGIEDGKSHPPKRQPASRRAETPSPWRPVLIVAGLAVLLTVAVRGWRAGWF